MRKIILYIATSLDMKIADEYGGVEWLNLFQNTDESDYGYVDFYNATDTIIMGNNTYKTILNFGIEFPYKNHACFVFSRNAEHLDDENVFKVYAEYEMVVKKLKRQKSKKNIWLMGGGELASFFLENKWIDEIRLFVMPIILGNGIDLFTGHLNQKTLKFESSKNFTSGAVELIYSNNIK